MSIMSHHAQENIGNGEMPLSEDLLKPSSMQFISNEDVYRIASPGSVMLSVSSVVLSRGSCHEACALPAFSSTRACTSHPQDG